jgi:hypothetical protein
MDQLIKVLAFLIGFVVIVLTLSSALSTLVLPRGVRSQLNRIVFGLLRHIFNFLLHFAKSYEARDAIMAYYAPLGLMLLLPTWYILILTGYAAIYWSLGAGDLFAVFRLSGSSLFTLGFDISKTPLITAVAFSEAMLGLMLVGLLIAYLPTMYSAFSRREQVVNMLEVRAGSPPSAAEMLLRFHRNHGLEKLSDYWRVWESWFADIEESHTTLPGLIFSGHRAPKTHGSGPGEPFSMPRPSLWRRSRLHMRFRLRFAFDPDFLRSGGSQTISIFRIHRIRIFPNTRSVWTVPNSIRYWSSCLPQEYPSNPTVTRHGTILRAGESTMTGA